MKLRAYLWLALALTLQNAVAQDAQVSRLDTVQKAGKLRVCTPGDYRPFSLLRPDGAYEGIDIDLAQSAAKALGVEAEIIEDILVDADEGFPGQV